MKRWVPNRFIVHWSIRRTFDARRVGSTRLSARKLRHPEHRRHAQVNNDVSKVAQPIGFADIVQRSNPSVISVKVTMSDKAADASDSSDDQSPAGPPMERFFRQFGGPDGAPPEMRQHHGWHRVMMRQGSGFFISPDGYSVTNNHVVEVPTRSKIRPMVARPIPPR